ncbi:hypothetical protein PPYR_12029 [Photinus pyralis]|uniref:Integrase core domain-containing protein n=1 Tax=Photinus pyralis TaxID=7054 RepID=A0A1Y1MNG4_PHOPY|nr:uncharacterized protein LOC116177160 [Photinus pyralis]KAB0795190.1 hypothetical protein PPYR_12029 [Photinus pyralis]
MEGVSDLYSYITVYFLMGLKQSEILAFLADKHNIFISERHLRRKLHQLKLYRRKYYTNVDEVIAYITENVRNHGQLHGYRWMHLKCIQNGFVVSQEVVRSILHIVDPDGIEIRRRRRLRRRQYKNKGPNFLWHIDCYDKLKPFGICVSGCIDGFSRKIVWLKAGRNSNDPRIICGYYIQIIKDLGGCPQTVRADLGTENGIVRQVQVHLRELGENHTHYSLPPFLYGTSPNNQRIEAWWSILRKHHSQYWLNLFHKLKDDGLYSGNFLDKSLIQFCFMSIIQKELDTVAMEWDLHQISRSRNAVSPIGKPFIMYNIPEVYGTKDYLCNLSSADIGDYEEQCLFHNCPCDDDFYELCVIIMSENGYVMPKTSTDAVDLYLNLRHQLLPYFAT